MSEHPYVASVRAVVEELLELNPPPDSPEWLLLARLISAQLEYDMARARALIAGTEESD